MKRDFRAWLKEAFSQKNRRELGQVMAYLGKQFFFRSIPLLARVSKFLTGFILGFLVFTKRPPPATKGKIPFVDKDPFVP